MAARPRNDHPEAVSIHATRRVEKHPQVEHAIQIVGDLLLVARTDE